jgi:hypothetical protein
MSRVSSRVVTDCGHADIYCPHKDCQRPVDEKPKGVVKCINCDHLILGYCISNSKCLLI